MKVAGSVDAIDWSAWVPTEKAVLCFVRKNNELLLIHKKTGLGKGKINAPGGRIEASESALQAAIRETSEEVGIVPDTLTETGQLFFEFTNGYKLHGTVFFAAAFTGNLIETYEAAPFWCDINSLPYDRMWEDDRHWLPLVLSGKYIKGYFVFDDDVMLGKRVKSYKLKVKS
jgi:8-oxo-dGTP diphosphatase